MVECAALIILPLEELEDKGHTHKLTILNLAEVCGTWVGIYVDGNLVDTRQWVKHRHMLLRKTHLRSIQHKAILNTLILIEVCETLLLNTRHIEDIYIADNALNVVRLAVLNAVTVEDIALDLVWKGQLRWRDKHEFCVLVARHRLDKRVYSTTILQIANHIYVQII